MSTEFETLQRGISTRQEHLQAARRVVSLGAERHGKLSGVATALTVVLGAVVASREVAETLSDGGSKLIPIGYAAIGVLIAAIAGLEAAFHLRDRAATLRLLATLAESTRRTVDTQWRKEVAAAYGEEKVQAAHRLLDLQDATLNDIQTQAAEAGVNLPFEVDELMAWEHGDQYVA